MDQTNALPDRGFTLIEIVIAVAIVATTVAAGFGISLASRSLAVSAAATEFDHLLDSTRTIARETQGGTLVFTPDAYGDGTEVRLMTTGNGGTLVATTLPALHTRATIEEMESLGKAPFAFVVHANGSLGGRPGFRAGDTTAIAEVGCPASDAFHFVLRAAGGSADRYVPCRIKLAATGPVGIVTWPAAPIAASPTPCGGPCAPTSLPTAPVSSPSCPPNFIATASGCNPTATPTPAGGTGPRYHVSASVASPTISVGATDSVMAQATLTNPSAVPAGTPATIPVSVQQTTSGICSASPTGWQSSGATFTLSGLSAGTCTVTVQADPSAVAAATADTATVSVAISTASPTASPSAAACDFVSSGRCYHRLVDTTFKMFWKYVAPDTRCIDTSDCWYIDSIAGIQLYDPLFIQPPVPPTNASNELLFKIDQIDQAEYHCQPFSAFAATSANVLIQWGGYAISAPGDAQSGFGKPSVYSTINHVLTAAEASNFKLDTPWSQGTTLQQLYQTVASRETGTPYLFTYSSTDSATTPYLSWYPDFAGCDVAGDGNFPGRQYGIGGIGLLFEIYQAVP